jgi:hypothetical protein
MTVLLTGINLPQYLWPDAVIANVLSLQVALPRVFFQSLTMLSQLFSGMG